MKKLKKYSHLGQAERDRIQALLKSGHEQKEIALILKVNKSTISREIKRNIRKVRKKGGTISGEYESKVAHTKAYIRRKNAKFQGKKIHSNDDLKKYITDKLDDHWSPDDISGRMKLENKSFYASKTTIYEWLYSNRGQYYCKYLYSKRFDRKRRRKNKTKRAMIPDRTSIKSMPSWFKEEYSYYQGDTIVSGKIHHSKTSLSVIYGMKAKYIDARKITSLQPIKFNSAVLDMKKSIRDMGSLVLDNGIENKQHKQLGVLTYFCDPYSSWQKGGVEHANKMIRKFVLKGDDIANYSDDDIEKIVNILNNKPRKSLGYKTPYEVMVENDLFSENFIKINSEKVALRG